MECELWNLLYAIVVKLGSKVGSWKYSAADIVVVYFWAALHDRPMRWAVDKGNWPNELCPVCLPSQATLSRRMRRSEVQQLMTEVEDTWLVLVNVAGMCIKTIDGKPLAVSGVTKDTDAAYGRGAGGMQKGYKFFAVWASGPLPIAWELAPMNKSEKTVARELIPTLPGGGYLLGDADYDSNPLHELAHEAEHQLLTPKRHKTRGVGLVCPSCQKPISATDGRWVARNPNSKWGHGYWINHLMVPWLNFDEILLRQSTYDTARFKNECLGLPTALGDHIITREEIEACCAPHPMATKLSDVPNEGRPCMLAGVDWGGGGTSATVVTIGYIRSDKKFVVVRFEQLRAQEDPECVLKAIAKLCTEFGVRCIAADGGGNGSVYNRLLLDKLGWRTPLYAILYSSTNQEPKPEGALHKWTVDRTGSIGGLFTRIKKQMTLFPRVEDCGSFLDQFTCVVAEHDEHNRMVRFVCPENQNDDALHSLNYVQLVGLRLWHVHHQYAG